MVEINVSQSIFEVGVFVMSGRRNVGATDCESGDASELTISATLHLS